MHDRGNVASAVVAATLAALIAGLALPAGAQEVDGQEAPSTGRDTLLAGVYSDQWEAAKDIAGLSANSPTAVSLAGTFHTLRESEDGWGAEVTGRLLEQVWSAQATPLANVNVTHTAYQVARGDADADIARWAGRVREWLDRGGGRTLLIAPMQEMNGNWVPYGMDPGNYRIAFRRFVDVARYYGLDETRVRWVFAPNGWSVPPHAMADYYPGHDVVDFVGVSAYNFGALVDFWTPVEWAVEAPLDEMRTFAPDKPFIVAQIGSSTAGGDRDTWLREMFRVLVRDPNVVGLVYFNFIKETDWKVWDGAKVAQGWIDGSAAEGVRHVWPLTAWFQPGPVPFQTHEGRFSDDDLLPVRDDIDWLAERGIVTGCSDRRFCPDRVVTRAQLATLLSRVFALPASDVDAFGDDDGLADEPAINSVVEAGFVDGCDPKRFCPHAPATRDVLWRALARAGGSLPEFHEFAPTPDPAKIEPICSNERVCAKKSLTRTYVAAALRTYLETGVDPLVSVTGPPPPRRAWWMPPDEPPLS